MGWGTVADWLVGMGTLVLAGVAVGQPTIHGWFYGPKFKVTTRTEPPDCVAVPITDLQGNFIADCVFLRLWIENEGNEAARNVEVYAKELRRRRADDTWERVAAFPPMNLKWANTNAAIYYPVISPMMGKHCDIAHVVDPGRRKRPALMENNPALGLADDKTSLTFDLQTSPNHRGHIVGPGKYELDLLIAAENADPIAHTIEIRLEGPWDSNETRMLRDFVGIKAPTA